MSKVFLSYSHKDETFVSMLYERLKQDGVNCFNDSEDIDWGGSIPKPKSQKKTWRV